MKKCLYFLVNFLPSLLLYFIGRKYTDNLQGYNLVVLLLISEVIVTTTSHIHGILWSIVDQFLPCHTAQLATEYLDLTMADVQIIQEKIRENPQAVTYHCLLAFLRKNADEEALYDRLERAGVEQGLIPRSCLQIYKGLFTKSSSTMLRLAYRTL